MIYVLWLGILLSPYWLGPILVWATQRWSTHRAGAFPSRGCSGWPLRSSFCFGSAIRSCTTLAYRTTWSCPRTSPARFRARGFYLFRSGQRFGITDEGDRVALFPRSDSYKLVRLMGTNGWNYQIGPDSIVVVARGARARRAVQYTGIGFDWIEGRFLSEPRDPGALARRFYAFCPDIVDRGTETVAALASELRRSRTLYCWWD